MISCHTSLMLHAIILIFSDYAITHYAIAIFTIATYTYCHYYFLFSHSHWLSFAIDYVYWVSPRYWLPHWYYQVIISFAHCHYCHCAIIFSHISLYFHALSFVATLSLRYWLRCRFRHCAIAAIARPILIAIDYWWIVPPLSFHWCHCFHCISSLIIFAE